MGPVQRAIRDRLKQGQQLRTPVRKAPFVLAKINHDGIQLLQGKGAFPVRLPWECLEGLARELLGRGCVRIGGKYERTGDPGTVDAYLKQWTRTATANWVASVLEEAGVAEIDRRRPACLRLIKGSSSNVHLAQ
jgi:hypothetical protein